jgi:hypothetical protein
MALQAFFAKLTVEALDIRALHPAIRNHRVQRHFVCAGGLGTTVAAGIISAMNISACSRDTASAALREFFVADD